MPTSFTCQSAVCVCRTSSNGEFCFNFSCNLSLGYIVCLSGFHTRCLYWVSRRRSPRGNYASSPPMKLMTGQSLSSSSASSVMTMSHRIDLAGLGHRINALTLHCFLTKISNQSDKIPPPYPPGFYTNQGSHPATDRSEPWLSADTQQDAKPFGFFPGPRRCSCSSENF